MTEQSAVLEVLEYAIRNERLGHGFYMRAMEMTDDVTGKRMFQSLASDEEEHIAILQSQFDSLRKTSSWLNLEEARVENPPSYPPTLFPEEETEVQEMMTKCASDLDALDIALDLERRGYQLYRNEAEKASNLAAKAVYEHLAKEENKHFVRLQNTRAYLSSSGAWHWDDVHSPMLD
jgi:rubrerythrin